MNTENIKTVAVIGAGIMGEGIAQNFAQAGLSVRLIDQGKDVLDRCLHEIDSNLSLFMEFSLPREKPFRKEEISRELLQQLALFNSRLKKDA